MLFRSRSGFFDIRNGDVFVDTTYGLVSVWLYDENMNFIKNSSSKYDTEWDSSISNVYHNYYVPYAAYARIVVRKSATADLPISEDYGDRNITVTFTPQTPSQD